MDVNPVAKSDSESPHVTSNEPADIDSFGSGTSFTLRRRASDHRDEDGENNGGPSNAKLLLGANHLCLGSPSLSRTFALCQASNIHFATNSIQGPTSSVNPDGLLPRVHRSRQSATKPVRPKYLFSLTSTELATAGSNTSTPLGSLKPEIR